jgi:hypothetical protein
LPAGLCPHAELPVDRRSSPGRRFREERKRLDR